MRVTNADRVVFPDGGYTKGDVVAYYTRAATLMLPLMADRPLTLQRFPKGLTGPGFMQKNAPPHYPDTISRFVVDRRRGGTTAYPVVHDVAAIAYLANQGTITFHAWTSTTTRSDQLDFLVIDLDPEEDDAAGARNLAVETRELLDAYGVASIPVATGSKGYHVWVPLAPGHGWQDVEQTGRAVAGLLVARAPDRATMEFLKRKRNGRVFVDWLRNRPGATVVVPYSLRPRRNAPIAVPLAWAELGTSRPDQWTLATITDRLRDPAQFPPPQTLPVQSICAAAASAGVDLDVRFDRFGRP